MKRKLTYTALATTASVALFAGAASAQMAPVVCSTTQISPAKQNCVMPTAAAPGGGSFPGSFLVPGTNTSFAVHGFVQMDNQHWFGQKNTVTQFNQSAGLEGPGIPATTGQLHALNGGTSMFLNGTRPNIETRTPTGYGELKTYVEFDFNQTSSSWLAGNNDLIRLRQAYGTLGPWLMGQTFSLFQDLQAYEDGANGNNQVGEMNTGNVRRPQVRYTWIAGNGVSIAGSVETQTFGSGTVGLTGTDAAVAPTTVAYNGATAYFNIPRMVAAAELDQPWGHVRGSFGFGATDITENNRLGGGSVSTPNRQVGDWAIDLSGHLNTWGKDALRGSVTYNNGAMDLNSWVSQGSWVENQSTGTVKLQKAIAFSASYEHFFNGMWRANAIGGWMAVTGNPFTVACTTGTACPQASLVKRLFSTEVNVIYSPVPQTDFILAWMHGYKKMQSNADGTDNAVDAQFKFYF